MAAELIETRWIWRNGEVIPWADAQVHVLTIAVQFGASVFEGIRAYRTPKGPAVFRLQDHIRRLFDSCRIYRMDPGFSREEIEQACLQLIAANELEECYIRPMVLRGYGTAGLNPIGTKVDTYIATWPWGTYLGAGALENGVDVCVSSWRRPAPDTFPAMAKAAGHYNNCQLIKAEAVLNGFAEAIALSPEGLVSEGSGQNLFLVRDGTVITPSVDGTFLHGITRDSIMAVARDLGIPVREQRVPREMVYVADELFFCGTAAEVTPVRSVDRIPIGAGGVGPITRRIQERFMDIVHGAVDDVHGWLTPVPQLERTGR